MNLKIFRSHVSKAQPFSVSFVGETVIDAGGPFRSVMSDVMEELEAREKVKCLKLSPDIPRDSERTFMLNEEFDDEKDMLVCLGGLLAFSFLTG